MELVLGLLTSLRPDLFNLMIALVGVGAVIKYRTKVSNELIPVILISVAFIVCSLTGWFHSTTSARWYDAFILGGIVDGFTVSAYAGLLWSALHGLYKNRKKKTGGEK